MVLVFRLSVIEAQMINNEHTPQLIKRQDYRPSAFLIKHVDLEFDLDPDKTRVLSRLSIERNPACKDEASDLVLDGEQLTLRQIRLNNKVLPDHGYTVEDQSLTVLQVPDAFELELLTEIQPAKNTALEGLYISGGNFCTQCEAEGFRRITYFLDRPDNLSRFNVKIQADMSLYPVLLSNGNRIATGELENNRHWAQWQDPFPKPCYLFALIAGDLVALKEHYTTASGRKVTLEIFVQEHNRHKCQHAMQSLIKAMRWDEQRFGLEYDLDNYMIVAVDDFNMGAMENKGLNIFNSKYVLANTDTATDTDFQYIEGVIGHEYFHNWTGNRITCRDWFQLSLKEGLTVFRDQEFSSDLSARAIKRIQDVQLLRTAQFAEDAGPMAHPVRPESYIEINNFYTVTVYEKGAELIRMQHTLLGEKGFKKGLQLYFKRHDGQAVTIEDFVNAMEDANGVSLEQFRLWYSQAGTPLLQVSEEFDATNKRYQLTFKQSCAPTPGQAEKKPVPIPVKMGLLNAGGSEVVMETDDEAFNADTAVLNVSEQQQSITFANISEKPIPSLLRGFSAPVKLEFNYTDSDLKLLMTKDSDSFNRWEACQRYAERVLKQKIDPGGTPSSNCENGFISGFAELLEDHAQDPALLAESLRLPDEKYLAEQFNPFDPISIHAEREALKHRIATEHYELLRLRYQELQESSYSLEPESIGRRKLKNLCLNYIMQTGKADAVELCVAQYRQADNMTDRLNALGALTNRGGGLGEDVLNDFYQRYQQDPLVIDKWFSIQASCKHRDAFENVMALTQNPAFSLNNPNRVRALIGTFCNANPVHFHHSSGQGYRFLQEYVLQLDKLNPQVAARLIASLNIWRRLVDPQRQLAQQQLELILAEKGLSQDVYEIASKALSNQ